MSEILKGSVGISTTKKKPKNNKADILLVRRYLNANGYKVSETGGISPKFLNQLSKAASKANKKSSNAYIEPNDKVMKMLKPKYLAAQKKDEKNKSNTSGNKTKMHMVKHKSKKLLFTPEDYLTAKEKLFRSLEGYVKALRKSQSENRKTVIKYTHTMASNDGFLVAIAQTVSVKAGRIKPPNDKLSKDAMEAVTTLYQTMSSRNLKKLTSHLKRAERLVNASSKDVDRFLKEFIGASGNVATALTVTSAVGFAIVGAMAAAPVAAATTLSAAQAGVVSSASVSVVASLSNDLGKAASNQKVTLYQAINNATIDGLVSAATAGIVSKLPPDFGRAVAKRIAPRLSRAIAGVSSDVIETYLEKYLAGAGEEACKSAIGSSIKSMGSYVKSGGTKAPSKKDFESAVVSALLDGATGGFLKNLTGYETDVSAEVAKEIENKVVPNLLSSTFKTNNLTTKQANDMATAMSNKLTEEAVKIGITYYFKVGTSKESPAKRVEIATRTAINSPVFKKKLQKAMQSELQKI